MPTTPNMSLVMPTEGSDADVWDTILNTLFTRLDAHDHTTGYGVQIPSAALKINADVSWAFSGTNYAITDAKAIDFAPVAPATVASLSSALFVSTTGNDLYFRNSGGTNVQITSGGTLNVSIVGGIGGDYASVGALLDYDDATDTYRARQELNTGVRQYAKFSIADLIIREYDPAGDASVPANTVTIKSPDALAGSYELTLPAALPGSTTFLQVSSTGVITASNDSTVTEQIPAAQARTNGAVNTNANHNVWTLGAGAGVGNSIAYPLNLRVGSTITGISVEVDKQSDATDTITLELGESNGISTFTAVGAFTATNSANAPGTVTLSGSGSQVVTAGNQYVLRVYQSDSSPSGTNSVGVATVTHT